MSVRFSWPSFHEPLRLQITAAAVDGRPLGTESLDSVLRRVDLGTATDPADGWSEIHLSIQLDPGSQPIPTGIDVQRKDLAGLVVLTSEAGYARIPAPLTRHDSTSTVFQGTLTVSRAEVAGTGRLEGEFTAEIDGVGHRVIGAAAPWAVAFDRGAAIPSGKSPLRMVWINFSEPPEGLGLLRQFADTPVHVEFGGDEPVVYLNKALKAFHTVLNSDHARGASKTVRDLLGIWVADAICFNLLRAGFAQIVVDEDGTFSRPHSPAVERAVEAIVDEMETVGSMEELAQRLPAPGEELDPALWGDAFLAACRLTKAGALLEEAAERVLYD